MKVLKIISLVIAFIVVFFVLFIFVLDSDFVEVRRLKGQIEINLGISFKSLPVLIFRENYGWAEEGGDNALLKISSEDCVSIVNIFPLEELSNEFSEYSKIFKKNGLSPKVVKTWHMANDHGDFTFYAIDKESCILYRQHHSE